MDLGKFLEDFGGIVVIIVIAFLSYLKRLYKESRSMESDAGAKLQAVNPPAATMAAAKTAPAPAITLAPRRHEPGLPTEPTTKVDYELPEEGIRAVADVEPLAATPRRRVSERRRRLRQALVLGDALRPKFNTY